MLPGPPRRCNAMFKACAMPYLRKLSDEIIVSHSLRIVGGGGLGRSKAARHDERADKPDPRALREGQVPLRVTAKAKTEAEWER